MVSPVYIQVGETVPSKKYPAPEPMEIPCWPYQCAYVVAMPRYGKGGLAKHLTVKLSKHKKLCIMDYNGEWSAHVTQMNYESPYPDCLGEYRIYREFTFKLSDFLNVEDWVSMGFHRATEIRNLFDDTMEVHDGLPDRFIRILADLPTESKNSTGLTLDEFNEKYGMNLLVGAHAETKRAWIRTMEKVKEWFWQGKDDDLRIYDFGEEWLKHEHIILDFKTSFVDSGIVHRNRTFFGKIMEKLRPYFIQIQGEIIVEEADILLPSVAEDEGIKPSSNAQVIWYVAKAPKYQMGILLIMQHFDQSDDDIRKGGQFQYFLGMYTGYPKPFKEKPGMRLHYYPTANYREFLFIDVNGDWAKFVPGVPCCKFESNIR